MIAEFHSLVRLETLEQSLNGAECEEGAECLLEVLCVDELPHDGFGLRSLFLLQITTTEMERISERVTRQRSVLIR